MGAIPIQSDEATLIQAVARETGGELAAVVFEATGVAACTRMTTAAVAQAGKIVLIGVWIYVAALWLLALDQTFHWGIFGPKVPPVP